MEIQWIIILLIVLFVIILQFKAFIQNNRRIKRMKNLFPSSTDGLDIQLNEGYSQIGSIKTSNTVNNDFNETLEDINSYLCHNKNKTFDYQILKEIVNRNSQVLEDEVDTMISVPLYLGLIATIFGVALGIIVFAFNGLPHFLEVESSDIGSVSDLLIDVGIAMFASFAGVLFTKILTSKFNKAKSEMSKRRNNFLTWIQTSLMPNLSENLTGALNKMTEDLNVFNQTFAKNTRELKDALSSVKDNYDEQIKLLNTIDKLNINQIAKANIDVYEKLQGCTEELGGLFNILSNSEAYVTKVLELNEKIGSIEERTRLFEDLGVYFRDEKKFIQDRQGFVRQQMSSIDSVLQESLSKLGENVSTSIGELTVKFQMQNEQVGSLIEEQQNSLAESIKQQHVAVNEVIGNIQNPFEGLSDVFEEGVNGIKESFAEQNSAIKELLSEQKKLLSDELASFQKASIQRLQEAPSQLQATTDLVNGIERLNNTLYNLERMESSSSYDFITSKSSTKQSVKHSKANEEGIIDFVKSNYLPICAIGSFFSLLVILVLKLFGF